MTEKEPINVNDISEKLKGTETDKALNPHIEQAEDKADAQWEKVKDKNSGVDKTLEKKLEAGTVTPEDLSNQGG